MINFLKRLFKRKPNKYAKQFTCNLHRDDNDYRDYQFSNKRNSSRVSKPIPDNVSFIEEMPEIWNQGKIGSCQSFAINRIISYYYNNTFNPSNLYTYYNVRQSEATNPKEDCGGTLRGTLRSVNKTGVCCEELHPYIEKNIFVEPSLEAYNNGIHRMEGDKLLYYRANTTDEIRQGMSEGFIPYIGVIITDSFYSDSCMKSGVIPMPSGKEYGGHALVISEYTTKKNILGRNRTQFTIENSWGKTVGIQGRFTCSDRVLERILMDC